MTKIYIVFLVSLVLFAKPIFGNDRENISIAGNAAETTEKSQEKKEYKWIYWAIPLGLAIIGGILLLYAPADGKNDK